MVDWIYTQCAEIVRSIEAVRDYLERDGVTTDSRYTQFIRGWAPSKAYISKVARIFSLKYQYNDRDDFGEFTLSGFDSRHGYNTIHNLLFLLGRASTAGTAGRGSLVLYLTFRQFALPLLQENLTKERL